MVRYIVHYIVRYIVHSIVHFTVHYIVHHNLGHQAGDLEGARACLHRHLQLAEALQGGAAPSVYFSVHRKCA